jgi:uncharacterized protein
MNLDPSHAETVVPTSGLSNEPSTPRKIFFGPNGLRAGWRLLIFVSMLFGLQYLILQKALPRIPVVAHFLAEVRADGVLTPQFQLVIELAAFAIIFLTTAIMGRIEKRPFGVYGIPRNGAFGKFFWQGVLFGFAYETFEMVAIWACGGYSFGTLALSGMALVKYAVLWAMVFLLVGFVEEFTFRGYAQYTLGSGIGFWPAAIVLSAAFGAVHLGNKGEGWLGAVSIAIYALIACVTIRRTGNLWFTIGFHAAGDYFETFLYSTPISGLQARGHLLNASFHGPLWLTGGAIGPEASVFAFILFAIAFLVFNHMYPAKRAVVS